ncbi:hypothetical protein LAD61_02315 [Klebsiella pneumoniae]|uniref:hypothetical protein n=1 Tax=Klebsiella pneumoniae TaxID=573 RepID=UPI00226DBA45|nr:hypothetical protein [Klebsiella pneumoniae]MCX9990987.1 hypothetical protein [Klebsiella pneumoniae]
MAITERDQSLIKALADEFNRAMDERDQKHARELEAYQQRITKLEGEVEGLISLLGE